MSTEKLQEELRSIFCEITELEEIPADKPLRDLGVDSMMALEIVTAIEKKYTLKLEEKELAEVATLERAVRLVAAKLAARG